MVTALEKNGIDILDVSERDDGEMRVIHRRGGEDSREGAALELARVGVVFLTLYTRIQAETLAAAVVGSNGESAATYHCPQEWAEVAADSDADPTEMNAERTEIAKKIADTATDLHHIDDIDDVKALLEEM